MSENRQKYSSSPLYGLKHPRSGGGGFQVPERPEKTSSRPRGSFVFLQITMTALLPVLFLAALILGYSELHWAFLACSALALAVMWLGHAFVPPARQTMTLIYTALMIVSFAAAMWFTQPIAGRTGEQGGETDPGIAALFGRDVTSRDVQGLTTTAPISTVTPSPDGKSDAERQLDLFMNAWEQLDYEGMLAVCVPSWVNAQADPKHSIFQIRGTSVPVDYEITGSAGTDADDSRTLTMLAQIDKGTGQGAKTYRYEVLMLRVNGIWYVDPASLSSATEIKEDVTPKPTVTLMPTYTPDVNQVLYYNPDGGEYYHTKPNCTTIAQKYQNKMSSFIYSQLGEAPYNTLKPCTKCNAPARGD
ncbi:MAG: hypothetical protein IJS41_05205 [Clostridia bacterium]|nr:hypothetical protein [Clostridia bacterium]